MFPAFALGVFASILALALYFSFTSARDNTPIRLEKQSDRRMLIGQFVARWWIFATLAMTLVTLYVGFHPLVATHPYAHLAGALPMIGIMLITDRMLRWGAERIIWSGFAGIFLLAIGVAYVDAVLLWFTLYGLVWGMAGWVLASLVTASDLWQTIGAFLGIAVGVWVINGMPMPKIRNSRTSVILSLLLGGASATFAAAAQPVHMPEEFQVMADIERSSRAMDALARQYKGQREILQEMLTQVLRIPDGKQRVPVVRGHFEKMGQVWEQTEQSAIDALLAYNQTLDKLNVLVGFGLPRGTAQKMLTPAEKSRRAMIREADQFSEYRRLVQFLFLEKQQQ